MTATDAIRNVALIGHAHVGKTTLLDAIAHHTRVTSRRGSAHDGTSLGDTEPEERERKQTLVARPFRLPLGDVRLNLFDTPGHPDFVA